MTDSPATAKIAVAAATYWVDRPFDYRIPPALADKVVPGVRVVVPFGGGNRRGSFCLSVRRSPVCG